jgi:hypothetical protein
LSDTGGRRSPFLASVFTSSLLEETKKHEYYFVYELHYIPYKFSVFYITKPNSCLTGPKFRPFWANFPILRLETLFFRNTIIIETKETELATMNYHFKVIRHIHEMSSVRYTI